ncbi:MAG: hypothetical protein EB127_12085, partial [Alphaproteobacteria bacterium]|nr:hypothetical protein [Alphaproteobacteria bacterium]
HSHKIYAKTLNIGSSLGNIFTIDNSSFNIENIYINANDTLILSNVSIQATTIDGAANNQGTLYSNPGTSNTIALNTLVGGTNALSKFQVGLGTTTLGANVTAANTSFMDAGTLDVSSYTLTSDIDFAGKAATISLTTGTITGSVDSTSSSGGILTLSSGTSSITGAIGNSNRIVSLLLHCHLVHH